MRAPRRVTALLASFATVSATLAGAIALAPSAQAHGSLSLPSSRVWECFYGDRSAPMCAAAWQANAQALYDWTEVNPVSYTHLTLPTKA